MTERLRRHAREQPWWHPGIWADVRELPSYDEMMAEERAQILALRPAHNVNWARCRAAGHEMDGKGRCVLCRRDYQRPYSREWRKNPERLEYEADYREEHREELRDYQRNYMKQRRSDPANREKENRQQRVRRATRNGIAPAGD